MPPLYNPDTNNTLAGLVLLILVFALPLTFLASMAILNVYRRAVLRTTRTRANIEMTVPASMESFEPHQEPVQTPLQISILDSSSGKTNAATNDGLYSHLFRGPWRAAAIYVVAGICYALATTYVFLSAAKDGFPALTFLILFWHYAWPIAVTVSLVAAQAWRTRLKIFGTYFLIILALGVIARLGNATGIWLQIVELWFLTNFPATLLLLVFLNRKIRAVGPLVLTFITLAVTGLVLMPTFVVNIGEIWDLVVPIAAALGLAGNQIFMALFILGFLAFGILGWLAWQAIGALYRRKKISEQSITIDAIWLLFAIFQAAGLIFEGDHWFMASLFVFVIYKGVAWVGFWLAGRYPRSRQPHPELLVLRVLAPGQRSKRLFEVLARHWRFAGSVERMTGPDLATPTMEPHEFLDFLNGKLARRFIDGPQTLDLRISEMDLMPDHDGQFRVNDFFCYKDTWGMVLSRLAPESDTVIMDLCGFSVENTGCLFEISELINVVPLERVVFIIDDATDEAFLRQVMQQSWENMSPTSPNRLSTSGVASLFRLNQLHDDELQRLLKVLSGAAPSATKRQVLAESSVQGLTGS